MADTYKIEIAYVGTDGDIDKLRKDFYAESPAEAKAKASAYFAAALVGIPADKIIMSEAKPVATGSARSVQINGDNCRQQLQQRSVHVMANVEQHIVHCVIGYSDTNAYLAAVYSDPAEADKERKRYASERQWQDYSWYVIVRALQ